jgi:acetyl-CoA C-acetyltransferase
MGFDKKIYIIDGARTPFLKAQKGPGPFAASDLATQAGRALLLRQKFAPTDLDEVILGCAGASADETNIGRMVALRMGCGEKVPGWTVMRNCASGMQALDSAIANILTGRSELVMAGGVDALSRAPLIYNDKMVGWFAALMGAKTPMEKAATFAKLKIPEVLNPVIGLMKGLTDPVVGLLMGQTAENLAWKFNITRQEMDEYSVRSHQRVAVAQQKGHFEEIIPLIDDNGKVYAADDGVRLDASMAGMAKLKPFFDKKYGNITAANSSQITDGAAWIILASEEAVKKHKLKPIGVISDSEWAGLDPAIMGLGPVHATTPLMQRNNLKIEDIDAWELNEAFAAQVIGCLRAWQSDEYCKEKLGLSGAFGAIDEDKLNIDGGAVALGHPVGASGARIVLHVLQTLRRTGGKKGIATICIGGGLGGSMLVETI